MSFTKYLTIFLTIILMTTQVVWATADLSADFQDFSIYTNQNNTNTVNLPADKIIKIHTTFFITNKEFEDYDKQQSNKDILSKQESVVGKKSIVDETIQTYIRIDEGKWFKLSSELFAEDKAIYIVLINDTKDKSQPKFLNKHSDFLSWKKNFVALTMNPSLINLFIMIGCPYGVVNTVECDYDSSIRKQFRKWQPIAYFREINNGQDKKIKWKHMGNDLNLIEVVKSVKTKEFNNYLLYSSLITTEVNVDEI